MRKILLSVILMSTLAVNAQLPDGYEVATWLGFKNSAVSYTFDDYTPNQMPVAVPVFDKYGFKATFYPILAWNPDWTKLTNIAANGHEVGSHTITHINLGTEKDTALCRKEIADSRQIINSHIANNQCVTLAYPYCSFNPYIRSLIEQYYIGARICSGQIESATPSDLFAISSIGCGDKGLNTSAELNAKTTEPNVKKGWCVFMFHGINNDGGYSPIQSTDLDAHLNFIKTNENDYWVGTFSQVIRYIRERDALKIRELKHSKTCISVLFETGLDKSVFNQPITIKWVLPKGWKNVAIIQHGVTLKSSVQQNKIVFDVLPDGSLVTINKIRNK